MTRNHKWFNRFEIKNNKFIFVNEYLFFVHDFRSSSFWRVQTQHKLLDLDEEPVPIYVMNRVIQRYY